MTAKTVNISAERFTLVRHFCPEEIEDRGDQRPGVR
jgi:hypothetical protein